MSTTAVDDFSRGEGPDPATSRPRSKPMTIGAVCKTLSPEFPDISISKIRYLEDQKLLTPRRTAGGYRLYTTTDLTRLRTILRLQRDEFLPLRVIRQELATGRAEEDVVVPGAQAGAAARQVRRPTITAPSGASFSLEEVLDETQADAKLVAELRDHRVIVGEEREGAIWFDETEREIVRAVVELARYGVEGRNLRVFRTSADREAALLQQLLAPALRSRNAERRREAVDALENLASVTTHLKHLLLVRDLRRLLA